MLLQQPCSMKAKEITLWEYTINYFFIAQLLSRQKAAISIVPLNTEGLQGRGRTTLKLQGSSTFPTKSPPSPLEKLKVRAKEHSPHGLTWFCSDLWLCTRLGLIAIRSMENCRGGKWHISHPKWGFWKLKSLHLNVFPPKPVTRWKTNAGTTQ